MGKLRFLFALWMAKLSIPALKITRHNGTDFPGSLAVKLCPDFLKYIGRPGTIVAVTGTNGKTTVANMLNDVLTAEGKTVLSNRAGSNIISGVSTALLKGCGLLGGTAGVEDDEGLLGQDADAAAVLHSGKARQNGLIGDLKALAPEGQRQLDRDGSVARRVTAQEGQRHGIAAVVHTAGELFGFEEGDIIGVRHDQLTVCLTGGHDELTDHSLGLLRRGNADTALAHDTGRQRGGALQ